jgi:hypothetical protein
VNKSNVLLIFVLLQVECKMMSNQKKSAASAEKPSEDE